jgi:hypothetical protein
MPDLIHTLQGHDLNFLKMIAGAWGVDLTAPDARAALPVLVQSLLDAELAEEVIGALPHETRDALQAVLENEGHMLWATFTRRFGEIRVLGAAARDRERPDLNPASPAETLWYRGLIGRAFLNIDGEALEYAYIPDDLLELFLVIEPFPIRTGPPTLGRPATPAESAHPLPATDRVLDQATTLLAALRAGVEPASLPSSSAAVPLPALTGLLSGAGLLGADGLPLPEPTRAFLEAPRAKALAVLVDGWQKSAGFNELRLLPGLVFEGEWRNDPLATRRSLLELLSHLPQEGWWNIQSFVAAVHEERPDFQRPAGDYDTWFIRKAGSDAYLRGFGSWEEVDGALIRFLITGPMYWLGLVDLAVPAPDAPASAFRPSAWSADLWHGRPPAGLAEENEPVKVRPDGTIGVPRLAPRALRYQLARFCQWLPPSRGEYNYRPTPASLERAAKQGLKITHLLAVLRKNVQGKLPPAFEQALSRWEKDGVQVRIEGVSLLRLSAPEILTALRATPAARLLGEELNPTTVIIKPGSEEKLLQALAEAGYLAQARLEGWGTEV